MSQAFVSKYRTDVAERVIIITLSSNIVLFIEDVIIFSFKLLNGRNEQPIMTQSTIVWKYVPRSGFYQAFVLLKSVLSH